MVKKMTVAIGESIYSRSLSKTLNSFVVIILIFNCVFSSLLLNWDTEDLAEMSSIQKDVFSAVFFISGTIEKINASVLEEIGLGSSKTDNDENKLPQPVTNSSKDVIITSTSHNQDIKVLKSMSDFYSISYSQNNLGSRNFLYDRETVCQVACIYFLIMLLFFSSANKIYDVLNKNNSIL